MGLKVAICQATSEDEVQLNLSKVERTVSETDADIFLFPELFLTHYGNTGFDRDRLETAERILGKISRDSGKAIAIGMPRMTEQGITNSLCFFSPEGTTVYDKLYLANFAPYNEGIFTAGKRPVMVSFKGWTFGLLICYDVMFPEIHRYYATHGADAVIMSSASAEKSKPAMEKVLPARSLENTVYTLFCNNIGNGPAGPFFGGSALYSPIGDKVAQAGNTENIAIVTLEKDIIKESRCARHHLEDLRNDIDWS